MVPPVPGARKGQADSRFTTPLDAGTPTAAPLVVAALAYSALPVGRGPKLGSGRRPSLIAGGT